MSYGIKFSRKNYRLVSIVNEIIETIVGMGRLHGVTSLREKHRYNITPWSRRLSDDEDSDTEDDERLAVAAAAAIFAAPRVKKTDRNSSNNLQAANPSSDRERLALDISTLKQQYAKLRERQRQAHIILSAACARQSMGPSASTASQAMNHLLVGKSALVSGKNRPTIRSAPTAPLAMRAKPIASPVAQNRRDRQQQQQQGVTIHWKDMKKRKDEREVAESAVATAAERESEVVEEVKPASASVEMSMSTPVARRASGGGGGSGLDSDSDSTSTELCDEPDRMSDLDSEEMTSTSDACPINNSEEGKHMREGSPDVLTQSEQQTTSGMNSEYSEVSKEETSIAEITDQIRRLSADDADLKTSLNDDQHVDEHNLSILEFSSNDYTIAKERLSISNSYDEKGSSYISSNFEPMFSEEKKYEYTDDVIQSDAYQTLEARTKDTCSIVAPKVIDSILALDYDFLECKLLSDKSDSVTELNSGCAVQKCEIIGSVVPNTVEVEKKEENEANGSSNITYPTKSSYVIGHQPIVPTCFEARRPGRISPKVFTSRDEARNDLLERNSFEDNPEASILGSETKYIGYKFDVKPSPKTPESFKSFDSGETMGPDSVTSSVVVTPLHSDLRGIFLADKSVASSVSSDSKTLTMRSIESDVAMKNQVETPGDKSVTPLTDSLMQAKSVEPACSSTESFCSPSKPKSEKSFSSDLQSPISANSIKFTPGYTYKNNGIDLQKPSTEIGAVTSPFYPISNPNKKTPSPYSEDKSKTSKDSAYSRKFREINEDQGTKNYLETKPLTLAFDVESKISTQAFDVPQLTTTDDNDFSTSIDDETFKNLPTQLYSYIDHNVKSKDTKLPEKDIGRTSAFEPYRKSKYEDELQETDTLSPLPRNQCNEYHSDIFERTRGRSLDGKLETLEISGKSCERSSSSLEKRFPEMLLSPSMEDFANSVKKRSSDVLEDLRHLESKSTEDGELNPNMLTRKTSFIWEDLKSLEARRQDTFSDSAKEFSRQRIEIPGISISMKGRKTYVVEPKINIDENSDSILKSVTYKNSNGHNYDVDDDRESKLGVWTKVKPRKRNDNGRRSSDRALKIIQENSVILQKILTCQARKRLPDLEEISKEITISPINEEISKIFSPILEKMGLNEHEINEELARINFKDIDRNTTTTTASEFEAKINDELSKLSLVGDNEEVAYLPDVDDLSSDYFVAREAFIDRQINEELSKLLVNYSEDSLIKHQKISSSLNATNDIFMGSKKSYSYQSSNDSLETKSDLGSNNTINSTIYQNEPISYMTLNNYMKPENFPTKNDADIYRELEKLNHTSYSQVVPSVATELHRDITSPYLIDTIRSPKSDYPKQVVDQQPTYDTLSPLKSLYNSSYPSTTFQSSYDYKSRMSPRKVPGNPYSVRSYDSTLSLDTGFENTTFEMTAIKASAPSTLNYEYGPTKHILSKEQLEFRLKYDLDDDVSATKKSSAEDIDLKLSPFQTDIAKLDKGASYYTDTNVNTPTNKYSSSKDNGVCLASSLGGSNNDTIAYHRKYDGTSPADKYSSLSNDCDMFRQPYKITPLDPEAQVSAYLSETLVNNTSSCHRDTHISSPNYHYDYAKSMSSSYDTVSPSFDNSSSTSIRTKITYSDVMPTDNWKYRKPTLEENKGVKYDFEKSPSPKSLGFSPFPIRNIPRKPKEVAVKLGLYSPTNSTPLKRS
ncbi:uncharacterized protein LOC106646056 [Copidosoma floridanum]|uniref:uncharacterized protein LOC106646056 n=1 Tax=Copidosoma floridanum TaxID=29053 RepID=UPI000C6F7351|nr:uncharacterized protein LOC106646056 [Copidosoma floridanum]